MKINQLSSKHVPEVSGYHFVDMDEVIILGPQGGVKITDEGDEVLSGCANPKLYTTHLASCIGICAKGYHANHAPLIGLMHFSGVIELPKKYKKANVTSEEIETICLDLACKNMMKYLIAQGAQPQTVEIYLFGSMQPEENAHLRAFHRPYVKANFMCEAKDEDWHTNVCMTANDIFYQVGLSEEMRLDSPENSPRSPLGAGFFARSEEPLEESDLATHSVLGKRR